MHLEFFRDLVVHEAQGASALSETANALVAASVEERYPGQIPVAELPDLVGTNAAALEGPQAGSGREGCRL